MSKGSKRTIQKPKSRYAKILFDKDSPFKHKVVKDKTKYNRKGSKLELQKDECP